MSMPPYGPREKLSNYEDGRSLVQLVGAVRQVRDVDSLLKQQLERPIIPVNQRGAFALETVNLADTDIAVTAGKLVGRSGYGLVYLKDGSHPGGRLDIDVGGRLPNFSPGSRVRGFFDSFRVRRSSRSIAAGTAQLLLLTQPDADYREPNDISGLPADPVDLLGTSSTPTFTVVAENTQPSGAAPDGSFAYTGTSLIRVIIDGQGANTLTSVELIPWVREPNSATWYEQGSERISLPDSDSTAYRYRVFTLAVRGNGLMYFEIRNLLPAAQTQLGFIVQALT